MDAIPFYKSATFLATLVTIIVSAAALFGLTLAPDIVSKDLELLISAVTMAAGVLAAVKRWTSKIQPLAPTKAAAEAHPQTVANTNIFTPPLPTKDDTK